MNKGDERSEHYYLLPSGQKAADQLEGRTILGIGRNAFRNRVKNGIIKKVVVDKR